MQARRNLGCARCSYSTIATPRACCSAAPQLAPRWQSAVVAAADQVIGWVLPVARFDEQGQNVRFSVGHRHLAHLRHVQGELGHTLAALKPALAFFGVASAAICWTWSPIENAGV